MTMPFETSHLASLGLNFVISGVGTIKNFTLYETELLENAVKVGASFSKIYILTAYYI